MTESLPMNDKGAYRRALLKLLVLVQDEIFEIESGQKKTAADIKAFKQRLGPVYGAVLTKEIITNNG